MRATRKPFVSLFVVPCTPPPHPFSSRCRHCEAGVGRLQPCAGQIMALRREAIAGACRVGRFGRGRARSTMIGPAQRAQPMGDDERRSSAHGRFHRGQDFMLRARIDRGQGVVENQDRRLQQDRPGDGQPLPLSARKIAAMFADDRVVAVRQFANELVGRGDAGRALDLLAASRRAGRRRCSTPPCC